jgi:hypothetical protein
MNSMIANYQNGNLREAKEQAKRFSYRAIVKFCQELGWPTDKAIGVADYLKGYISFQMLCDKQENEEAYEIH